MLCLQQGEKWAKGRLHITHERGKVKAFLHIGKVIWVINSVQRSNADVISALQLPCITEFKIYLGARAYIRVIPGCYETSQCNNWNCVLLPLQWNHCMGFVQDLFSILQFLHKRQGSTPPARKADRIWEMWEWKQDTNLKGHMYWYVLKTSWWYFALTSNGMNSLWKWADASRYTCRLRDWHLQQHGGWQLGVQCGSQMR